MLETTVKNIMLLADENNLKTLALTSIGSGRLVVSMVSYEEQIF